MSSTKENIKDMIDKGADNTLVHRPGTMLLTEGL
jgi:hypothetical protein